jgi:hypothetical protein
LKNALLSNPPIRLWKIGSVIVILGIGHPCIAIANEPSPKPALEPTQELGSPPLPAANIAPINVSNNHNPSLSMPRVTDLNGEQPQPLAREILAAFDQRYQCLSGRSATLNPLSNAMTYSQLLAIAPPSSLSSTLSRYELAAMVQDCLSQLDQSVLSDSEWESLKLLVDEFIAELRTLDPDLQALEPRQKIIQEQQFSRTTKLSAVTVFGPQFSNDIGSQPLQKSLASKDDSRDNDFLENPRSSAIAASFLALNTSFNGKDTLKTTFYIGNFAHDIFSEAQLGSTPSNPTTQAFFPPSRTVWSRVPSGLALYRLSYQFQPAKNLTLVVGPRFFATDLIDNNRYTAPITSFNTWPMTSNPLINPYELRLSGGAGAGFSWAIPKTKLTLRGVYLARSPGNAVTKVTKAPELPKGKFISPGGLFDDPYQGSAELEYAVSLDKETSFPKQIAVRLQYTHSKTSGVEQDVVGLNTELTLGSVGFFGRYGYSWAQAASGVNPLPFGDGDAGKFHVQTFHVGMGIDNLGVENARLAIAVSQPFITNLRPQVGIDKATQTNLEAFYRIPLNDHLSIAPTLITVFNPNNRGDQPTLIQGFLRFTFLY